MCLPGKSQCVFVWLFMNKKNTSEWLTGNFIKPLFYELAKSLMEKGH